jgi:hypothetical protein
MLVHQIVEAVPPRELSQEELKIFERLLSAEFSGCAELRSQVSLARVFEECTHCPTIGLLVDHVTAPKANVKGRVPVEAEVDDKDGVRIHLLLHVVNGFLNELEVFREDGSEIYQLPMPETLKILCLDET